MIVDSHKNYYAFPPINGCVEASIKFFGFDKYTGSVWSMRTDSKSVNYLHTATVVSLVLLSDSSCESASAWCKKWQI